MTDRPPIPVNYETPQGGAARPVTSIPLTISLSLLYGFLFLIAVWIAPRFEMIFRDFKTELPAISALFLVVCRWFAKSYGWAMLLPIPIVLPIAVTQLTWRERTEREKFKRMIWLILISVILFVLVALLAIAAFFAPMLNLFESVSTPGKK